MSEAVGRRGVIGVLTSHNRRHASYTARFKHANKAKVVDKEGDLALKIRNLLADRSVRRQLGAQTPLQLLAEFGDFHAGHDEELAT